MGSGFEVTWIMLLKSWLGRFWPRFGWSAVVDVGQLGEIRPNLNKWEELWQLARSNIKQIEQTNKQMNDKLTTKKATGNKTIRGIMDFWVVISFNLLTKTFVSVHQFGLLILKSDKNVFEVVCLKPSLALCLHSLKRVHQFRDFG